MQVWRCYKYIEVTIKEMCAETMLIGRCAQECINVSGEQCLAVFIHIMRNDQ